MRRHIPPCTPTHIPTHGSETKAINPLLGVRIVSGVYISVCRAFEDKSSRSLCLYLLQKMHMSDTIASIPGVTGF